MSQVIDPAFVKEIPENVMFVAKHSELNKFLLINRNCEIICIFKKLGELANLVSFGNHLINGEISLKSVKDLPVIKSGLIHSLREVPPQALKKCEKKIKKQMERLEKESIFMYSLSLE